MSCLEIKAKARDVKRNVGTSVFFPEGQSIYGIQGFFKN